MDRRSRRKNMSILPPIEENDGGKGSRRSSRWRVAMLVGASCMAGCTYHSAGPRRRLSATRKTLRSIPKHTLLFDDGTLFAPEGSQALCEYFANSRRLHTEIKRLHLYLPSCNDSTEQLDHYFEALLLANAAQIPFTVTCADDGNIDTLTARLLVDSRSPGPRPTEGRSWTASDVCRTESDTERLSLVRDAIQQTIRDAVPRADADDFVLQFDASISMSAYTELITEARFEGGTIESVAIIGAGSHLLTKHIERTFPEIAIETVDLEEGNFLDLYSRLMNARVAGVCSVPSLCGYAMVSGVGGFLNQEGCPAWISSAAQEASSPVELFKAARTRIA